VTPVDLSRGRERVEAQLGGHSDASISLIAAHEAFPGQHLQLSHATSEGSRLRRLHESPLLTDGWALYSEELMREQGFYSDPAASLVLARNLLWRACRVVLDVELHCGRMTFGEAVEYLENHVMLDRESAEMEVKRHALRPCEALCYHVGKSLLLSLREEVRQQLGARFDLGAFHAAVLGSGSIPLFLVREEVRERLGVA
jgi:uncharacterized protein (DUF885 family)